MIADLMMPVKLPSSGRVPTHKMSALASRGLTFVTWRALRRRLKHTMANSSCCRPAVRRNTMLKQG